ncbi:MAG: ABC transporter ATP-binding protein [Chloroflexi bacterium]|nr:ABC transporter ATP-binding protein [Chloroflexota bacterium]
MNRNELLKPLLPSTAPLVITQLVSGYEKDIDIVKGVSLELQPRTFSCILGANGCGKTTFLKTLLGILPARRGKVHCNNTDILSLNESQRAKYLAYIPQAHRPPFPFTVSDVVRMGRTPHLSTLSRETVQDREISEACLDQVGLLKLAQVPYTLLSGGQQQLVIIARALAQQASFLIMDEPISSLDYGNQYRVLDEIAKLCELGLGVLMVTHDPAHCFHAADQVIIMEDGFFISAASPQEAMTSQSLSALYHLPVSVQRIKVPENRIQSVCIPLTRYS